MGQIGLVRNFSWSWTGNLVSAACQWGMLVALARLGTAEAVGCYALALALTAPVTLLCDMQLRALLATEPRNERRPGEFIGFRLASGALQMVVIGGLVAILGYRPDTAAVIVAVGLNKTLEGVSDILYGVMQNRERLDRIALSQMLRCGLSLVILSVTLASGGSLLEAVLGMTVAILGVVGFDLVNARLILKAESQGTAMSLIRPTWTWNSLRSLFKLGIALGLSSMLMSCYSTVPRYFLEWRHGRAALGYFATMAYFSVAGRTVIEAMGQAALPRLAMHWREDRKSYRALLGKSIGLSVGLGIFGMLVSWLFGAPLLRLIYGPAYAQQSDVLVLLMAAAGLVYICAPLTVGLTAAGRLRVQLPITVAVVAAVLACSALWIPGHGARGAAWALILSSGFWVAGAGSAILWTLWKDKLPRMAAGLSVPGVSGDGDPPLAARRVES